MIATTRHRKRSIWFYYVISAAIVLVSLLMVAWYSADRFREFFILHLETVLESQARNIARDIQINNSSHDQVEQYCFAFKPTDPDLRVTIVDFSGDVICDSEADPASMENHHDRPEIKTAYTDQTGRIIRFSSTLKAHLLYVAILLNREDGQHWAVRTALPLSSIDQLLGKFFRVLLIVLLTMIVFALLVSLYLYRKINLPLFEIRQEAERFARGNFESQLPDYQVREIADLAEALNSMAVRLDRLDNLRMEFVGNVSHELKTPVTTIMGFVEILLEGAKDDPEDLERFLKIVARQTDRLSAIIDDLLTLSRLENAPLDDILDLKVHSLCMLLESSYQICHERAEAKNITLRINCPTSVNIFADSSLLIQAIVNLIDNAIKYSPEYTYVTLAGIETSDSVAISVSDNGPGIEEDHLTRLFERFYRVDKARSRKMGGTGLGLAIVKHIVSVHEGEVKVETSSGQGSTFTILLPAHTGWVSDK
ncbi:ATP-binding protein [Gammaproteobacteria bacterium]|nr:ATP-binding protein [Gammaproteobacteria bacterium]